MFSAVQKRKKLAHVTLFKRLAIITALVLLCIYLFYLRSTQLIKEYQRVYKQPKFYIYGWDPKITDAWPLQYVHHRISIGQEFRQNAAVGPLVDAVTGMYHTHQYSLFTLVLQRLLESEYRTTNPDEASLFFIPYDLGMDATTRSSDGGLVQTNCPRVGSVLEKLQNSPHFHKKQGVDHFLLHTINQMMVYYANEKCTRLYEVCANCTKLSIDTYPPGVFSHLDTHPFMSKRWISIPFPSNFHVSATTTRFPWRAIEDNPQYMSSMFKTERQYELCFVGSAQVTAKLQRQLRLALMETCKQMPHTCLLVPLNSHESHERPFDVYTANSKAQVYNPYSLARFCLTPGGDFPTRKGFFDAMLSGCVPVIFERTAALTQWPLHWRIPKDEALTLRQSLHSISIPDNLKEEISHSARARTSTITNDRSDYLADHSVNVAADCVLYVPRDVAMRNMSETFAYLARLSRDSAFMATKLRCIAKVGHQMQYSMPRGFAPVAGTKQGFSTPQKDAVDIFLEYLLNWSSK